MEVHSRSKKASKTFFPGDFKNMIRDNFQPKGWNSYSESPYKEYRNRMESLGYEGYDKPGNREKDS